MRVLFVEVVNPMSSIRSSGCRQTAPFPEFLEGIADLRSIGVRTAVRKSRDAWGKVNLTDHFPESFVGNASPLENGFVNDR